MQAHAFESACKVKWDVLQVRLQPRQTQKRESYLLLVVCDTKHRLCRSRYQHCCGILADMFFAAVIPGVQYH